MKKVGKFVKRAGLILLGLLLTLVVVVGAFVVWLRAEPEQVTACEDDQRLIDSGVRPTCIPENAERVVPGSPSATQFFLAIGYRPGGHSELINVSAFLDHPELVEPWNELTEGIPFVGGTQVSLESVLAADPDVIISEFDLSSVARGIELIAPVVEVNQADDWKANILTFGEVVGEREQAEELLAGYDERVEILRQQFEDPSAISISTFSVSENRLSLHLTDSFSGQVLEEIGFSLPDHQLRHMEESETVLYTTFTDISMERLDLLDGDVIFMYGLGDADYTDGSYTTSTAPAEAMLENPLFQQLDGVQANAVYPAGSYWGRAGIYSAHKLLDDLFRYVAGGEPEEVAPNPLLAERE